MTKARKLIVTAVLAAAAVALPPTAIAGGHDSVAVEQYCEQVSGYFPIDYAVARNLVPAEYQIVQVSPGYALLYVPFQDCMSVKVNGEEIGRTPIVHFWIRVGGPDEYVEVMPGASAKRNYFYSVDGHTTKNLLRKLGKQLGLEGDAIESMTLGEAVPMPEGGVVRVGANVVEKRLGNGSQYGYRWQATVVPHPTVIAPVVSTFYHTKNPGKNFVADVRCMVWVDGSGGSVLLTVDPLSSAAVFGHVLTGESNHLTMKCDTAMSRIK